MSIAIITPTRNRLLQLLLVILCINNQTVKPDMWVIVDDGPDISQAIKDKIKVSYKYINYKSNLISSTCMNSAKCLLEVIADKYIFIDDDDYYPPDYILYVSSIMVNDNLMVGNRRWTDYRLSTGYWRVRMKCYDNCILGDTMSLWHGSAIMGLQLKQDMITVLKSRPTDKYNDVVCYKALFAPEKKYNCRMFDFKLHSCISLKDYGTGNPGLIKSHRSNNDLIADDIQYTKFKLFLGLDWIKYSKFLGRLKCQK